VDFAEEMKIPERVTNLHGALKEFSVPGIWLGEVIYKAAKKSSDSLYPATHCMFVELGVGVSEEMPLRLRLCIQHAQGLLVLSFCQI
jgi:hypothetical protein